MKDYNIMKWALLLFIISVSMVKASNMNASSSIPLELKVKTSYIYNFTRFIEWPDSSGDKIKICVLGEDNISRLLKEVINKRLETDKFEVITDFNSDLTDCQIVYISKSVKNFVNLLEKLKMHDVLTVSDTDSFVANGGMIGFFNKNGKIRFEVNLQRTNAANIHLSSKLLGLAKIVK